MEIERKWMLTELPDLKGALVMNKVIQGYVIDNYGEMRYQKRGEHYRIGIKSEGDLSRKEFETEVPEWVFNVLKDNRKGNTIEKDYYRLCLDEILYEIDVFAGNLSGLIILEIEFSSIELAESFNLPKCFSDIAIDVTYDLRYKNKNLARYGLPKI